MYTTIRIIQSGVSTALAHPDRDLSRHAGQCLEEPLDPGLALKKPVQPTATTFHLLKIAHRFALWIPDSFVNTKNQARCFRRAADSVEFDKTGFPDKCFHVIADALGTVNVDTKPFGAVRVLHPQFVQDVGGVETGIITYLSRDDFERLCEGGHHELQFTGDREGVLPYVS